MFQTTGPGAVGSARSSQDGHHKSVHSRTEGYGGEGEGHFLSIFENGCVSPTTPEDTCRFYSNLLNFLRKGNYPKSDCY